MLKNGSYKENEVLNNDYKIVGYVNKMTEIYHNLYPLFKVEYGIGENKLNDFEGLQYLNFYGTSIIGPVLTKNPLFLKGLIIKICKNIDNNFKYKEIEYAFEETGYKNLLNELIKKKGDIHE